jgi:glycerophosphoryl diester phosphodiesterase
MPAALLLALTIQSAQAVIPPERPLCIAHRGFGVGLGTDPAHPDALRENSWPSLARALDVGADGVEFDLLHTADQVAVLIHDPTLTERPQLFPGAKEAGVTARLSELGWADLERWASSSGQPPLDRLDEVLAKLATHESQPGGGAWVLAELKDEPNPTTIGLLAQHARAFPSRVVLLSFCEPCLDRARELLIRGHGDVSIPVVLLDVDARRRAVYTRYDGLEVPVDPLWLVDGEHPGDPRHADIPLPKNFLVGVWPRLGLEDTAFLVRDGIGRYLRGEPAAVHFITTDRPDRCARLRDKLLSER